MKSGPRTQRQCAHAQRLRLSLCVLAAALAILSGCGGAPKRAGAGRDAGVGPAASAAPSSTARPSRGGYYQDDGPGDHPPANLDRIEDAEPRVEPLHRFANNPYVVFGQQYVPYKRLAPHKQRGIGSWYGRKFHGQRTSSGETYDMYAMSAAHATLPIPSYARVTNLANGKSVVVRINDRGPFHSGRLVDLSYAAAYKLGYAGAGSAQVEVEAILREDMPLIAARRRQEAQPATAAAPPPMEQPDPVAAAMTAAALADASQLEAAKPVQPIPLDTESGGIYLQLGAFSGRDNAENFRARVYQQLAWLNDAIEIFSRGGMYRLHLGPYRNRAEANAMAEKIRAELEFKPLVVGK